MKVLELIRKLQQFEEAYGDLAVYVHNEQEEYVETETIDHIEYVDPIEEDEYVLPACCYIVI